MVSSVMSKGRTGIGGCGQRRMSECAVSEVRQLK